MKNTISTISIGFLLLVILSCSSCGSFGKKAPYENDSISAEEPDMDALAASNIAAMEEMEDMSFEIEAVDLGLSVLWANANIGAISEEDFGYFVAWGESQEKSRYDLDDYFDYRVVVQEGGSILNTYERFHSEAASLIGTEFDIAQKTLGGNWRMPTPDEYKELIDKCQMKTDYVKDANNHVILEYIRVTGPNGKSIIFPMGGYKDGKEYIKRDGLYWTANLPFNNPTNGDAMAAIVGDFIRNIHMSIVNKRRCYGLNVRAVLERNISTAQIQNGTYDMEGRFSSVRPTVFSITIENTNVTGKIVYATASANGGYRLEGSRNGNDIKLTQINHLDEVIAQFDGVFDGKTYRGKYKNEDNDKEADFRFTIK